MSDFSSSLTIPEHFRRQFSDVWGMTLQQKTQKFGSAGMLESGWTAKEFVWTDLDAIDAVETTGQRFGDSNPSEVGGGKRKGYQRQFEVGIKRDQWDNQWLEKQALPDSDIVTAMKAGLNRKLDDMFIDASTADALGGADPYNTAIPLPATSQVAVNYVLSGATANSGLTPYKILEAKKRFETAEIDLDMEELYLAITPKQKLDLVAFVAASPNDVWARIVGNWLENSEAGKLTRLMGFNVITSNRLGRNTLTDVRTCVAFCKSAFKVSPLTQRLEIDKLPTKRHALQIMSYVSGGAMRAKDQGVQLIYCDESP